MLAKCRILSAQPGNKCAANGLKTEEKKTKYSRNILGDIPSCGKIEETYNKCKTLQCKYVCKHGKTHEVRHTSTQHSST
jgi:hypothetical protein